MAPMGSARPSLGTTGRPLRPDTGSKDMIRNLLSLALKAVVLPFRFLWLLGVWLRLRYSGRRASSSK
jgi:hypothetical protein